ncbi:type II secretion system protein [Pseudoduganella sp. UC29_106]|uniref:type II secretion system protein n=1 Tax=Pseudoduganella sp. UC29_106 TaxID=3374553 RepID=UPI003757A8B8
MTAAASLIRTGRQRGFTYLSVVILVAIIGLVGAATLRLGVTMQRAAAEEELLRIGAEFSDALQSYAAATPAGQPTFPPSLKELLKDPRFPQVRRHLRRIYVDPMTGKPEWGLVRAGINKPGTPGAVPGATPGAPGVPPTSEPPTSSMSAGEGGIIGIYSFSSAEPIKIGNFPQRFVRFEGKAHVSDWKFTAETSLAPVTTAVKMPQTPAAPANPLQPQQPGMQPAMPQPKPAPQQEPAPQEPPQAPQEPEQPAEPPAETPEKAEPSSPQNEPERSTNDPQR